MVLCLVVLFFHFVLTYDVLWLLIVWCFWCCAVLWCCTLSTPLSCPSHLTPLPHTHRLPLQVLLSHEEGVVVGERLNRSSLGEGYWERSYRIRLRLLTHPINTSYQHTLSIYTLSNHPLNTSYQCTLSIHPINTSYQYTLSIYTT